MADSWMWWIMTSAISLYFVMLLLRGGFFAETRPNVRTTRRNSAPETHTRENVGFRLVISDQDG